MMVCAASSLMSVLNALPISSALKPHFQFDASTRLALKIQQGVPCELFISADEDKKNLELIQDRVIEKRPWAQNRLALFVKKGSLASLSLPFKGPRDLASMIKSLNSLGVGHIQTPIGSYTKQALDFYGLGGLNPTKIRYADKAQTLSIWMRLGAVQAVISYLSEAENLQNDAELAGLFPPNSHDPIVYTVYRLRQKSRPELSSEELYRLLNSKALDAAKTKYGFISPYTLH